MLLLILLPNSHQNGHQLGRGVGQWWYQTNHVLTGNRVAIKRIEVPCLGDNILTETQRTQMCRQLETEINCLRSLCPPTNNAVTFCVT